jgi:hypothetical protein
MKKYTLISFLCLLLSCKSTQNTNKINNLDASNRDFETQQKVTMATNIAEQQEKETAYLFKGKNVDKQFFLRKLDNPSLAKELIVVQDTSEIRKLGVKKAIYLMMIK